MLEYILFQPLSVSKFLGPLYSCNCKQWQGVFACFFVVQQRLFSSRRATFEGSSQYKSHFSLQFSPDQGEEDFSNVIAP